MSDPVTDAAIAAKWPERWAKANNPSLPYRSKARQQLRKRYAVALEHKAFVASNPEARCSSCDHGEPYRDDLSCQLDSDFHGYQIVHPEYVCTRWEPAQGQHS